MRINQFFITNDPNISSVGNDFKKTSFNEFSIFNHPNLNVSIANHAKKSIAVLGYIINPFSIEATNEDIASYLIESETKEELFQKIEKLSGRFAIVIHIENETLILNDCFAQRQVFYFKLNNYRYLSSSDKLIIDTLNIPADISEEKKELSKSGPFLHIKEHWFLTETEWDDRIKKLNANHVLNINTLACKRIPIFVQQNLKNEVILKEVASFLKLSIIAISKRYKLFMPITAGYDSRLLMTSSLKLKHKIQHYIFDRDDTYVKRDIKTAKIIAKKFDLNFKVIITQPLNKEFIKDFQSNFIVPRILPKTRNIQYFKNLKPENSVNITGIGGGLLKHFYKESDFSTSDSILKAIEYNPMSIHEKGIENWLPSAKNYCKTNNIELSDLFFHEVRTGKWASKFASELDYSGIEEFAPLNNRWLIYTILLNTTKQERALPKLRFYNSLIAHISPESTKIQFNSKTWRDHIKSAIFYNTFKQQYHKLKYRNKK